MDAPQYLPTDAQQLLVQLRADWEQLTERPLYPGQMENLLLQVLAYRLSLTFAQMNQAAAQNLIAFAQEPMLDYLGAGLAAPRIPAQYASTLLEISLATPASQAMRIAAGLRVQALDRTAAFVTQDDAWIGVGQQSVQVPAWCEVAGVAGNDYPVGTLTELDSESDTLAVRNITISSGGADAEDVEQYRARLANASAQYAVAGPRAAYVALARAVSPEIIAVYAWSPAPAEVNVALLTRNGPADATLCARVLAALSGEDVRPLTDLVRVVPATTLNYTITARYVLYAGADPDATAAALRTQLNNWLAQREQRLGQDVVPSQIAQVLAHPAVYDVYIDAPAGPITVLPQAWAHCTAVNLTLAGVRNG